MLRVTAKKTKPTLKKNATFDFWSSYTARPLSLAFSRFRPDRFSWSPGQAVRRRTAAEIWEYRGELVGGEELILRGVAEHVHEGLIDVQNVSLGVAAVNAIGRVVH